MNNIITNEKITHDKDPKFFRYLKRLVDATQIKEEERFDGRQIIQDFIHDKDSIIYHKKHKNEVDVAILEKNFHPRAKKQFTSYNIRNKHDLSEKKVSVTSINLLRSHEKQSKYNLASNISIQQQSRNLLTQMYDQEKKQNKSLILSNYHNRDYEFELEKTMQLNNRSPLIKDQKPQLRARMPIIFGMRDETRNNQGLENLSSFNQRAQSMVSSVINQQKINSTFEASMMDVNDFNDRSLNKYVNGMDSQQVLVDIKQRELNKIKRQQNNNSVIYGNNVQSISNVKTHWNKKILDPKIDKNYLHSVVKKDSENHFEETIAEAMIKYDIKNSDLKGSLTRNKMHTEINSHKQSKMVRINPNTIQSDYDNRSESKLSQILRISTDLKNGPSKFNTLNMNSETLNTVSKTSGRNSQSQDRNNNLKKKVSSPHMVVFVEDGAYLGSCKSFKLDLNFFKAKYFIEPPKFISQLPKDFVKIQRKFNKRAYLELLEQCSNELTGKQRVFEAMYTIDGELIESIDEIEEDCSLIIAGKDRYTFNGILNNRSGMEAKDLRMENSKIIKQKLLSQEQEWANQKYLEWIERICDKFNIENMQLALETHANNSYLNSNQDYRKDFIKKLGAQNNVSPTFQGGGFKNCNEFLLPQITGNVQEQLRRLRSNNQEKIKLQKDGVKSARWDDEFIKALDNFKQVNSYKQKNHFQISKPSQANISDIGGIDNSNSKLSQGISPYKNQAMDFVKNLKNIQTQAVQKEIKIKTHLKHIKSSRREKSETNATDRKLNNQAGMKNHKTLSYEECKKLSDDYLLPCKVVYELHSEFNSLVMMSKEKYRKRGDDALNNDNQIAEEEEDNSVGEEGIPLDIFREASSMLKEKHPMIQDRILLAMNISIHAKFAKINWQTFLMYNCIMKYYTATQKQYVQFWIEFLNPDHQRTMSKEDFLDLMEKLVRGSYTESTTLVSERFSELLYQTINDKNCCKEDNGEIQLDKLEKKLLKNEIELEYFNQTLKPIMHDLFSQ
ncbi:UNKNOWN [Stylonychia lemnae]|uniref:Uncharacterized protein n=1 Tax=Stylonychia lemnae TaxID=5949 RepID=A0A077ZUL1_STYLE|nr:UNKNOWN [Stylonychia lemnae]|eukprot:CDW72151.1 UNKNOWN [Stylonychia lemnae]